LSPNARYLTSSFERDPFERSGSENLTDSRSAASQAPRSPDRSDKSGLISLRVPRIAFKADRTRPLGHARRGQCETLVSPSYMANRLAGACNTTYLFLFVRGAGSGTPRRCIFLHFVFALGPPHGHARGARGTLIAINCCALACLVKLLSHYSGRWGVAGEGGWVGWNERVSYSSRDRASRGETAYYAPDNSVLIKLELIPRSAV